MQAYKVGDIVVHWTYGSGEITAIDDKGLMGEPCFYYVIESPNQTLWVPVEENGPSSLHLPTSRANFELLFKVLRSPGDELSDNSYQRRAQLHKRMQKASPQDLCLIIRDLNYRSHRRKLNNSDIRAFKQVQSIFLDEWEGSLGTPRAQAKREMEWILREAPRK